MKKEAGANAPAAEAQASPVRPPLLVEALFVGGRIVVVAIGVGIAITSLLSGCSPLWMAVRVGTSVLLIGFVVWSIGWAMSQAALEAVASQLQQASMAPPQRSAQWEA
jgi:hypothetical protein